MPDTPTYRKALDAAKEAEREGMSVREIIVSGREFRLIVGKKEKSDDYVSRPLRREA